MASLWSLSRGGSVRQDGSVRFSVWAPKAETVSVRLLSGDGAAEHPMERDADGVFSREVHGIGAGLDYCYRLDGGQDRPDPVSRHQPQGVHGPSRVVDPRSFRWSDAGWSGIEMADLVLYELHVGTFTPAGTFEAAIERLPDLRELGVTAIEIMPVAEFPGSRNWGYDGASPYAAQSTYGGPRGLQRLVDAAHRAGIAVVLDVVYNHLGPEGNYLPEFGPYFTERYRTPWGAAINYDGADSDEVRRYFVDNALYWTTEFHVDGLRLDAVHAIYDFSARHVLEEIAHEVHEQSALLGRRTLVIAESDLNDPRVVRPRERGGYGVDGQWADDFHHAVHATLTGEREGYYQDFGGTVAIAKAIRDRWIVDGAYSTFRRRRHGAPATDVPRDRVVVFVQNHDQVGNRANGERLSALLTFDDQKLAAAFLLLSPYVPLLFMGEEYGETSPFLYFVSHGDPELVEAVRRGRREEFQAFDWQGEVPDPQAEETFARSRLEWSRRNEPRHGELLRLSHDALRVRRSERALRPGSAEVQVAAGGEDERGRGWIVVELAVEGRPELMAVFNLSADALESRLPERLGSGWELRLSTEDVRYGGSGRAPERLDAGELRLPGRTAVLYGRSS